VLLVDLYKREKRWKDAAAVATDLSTRYPRNYLFKLQIADALSTEVFSKNKNAGLRNVDPDQQRVFDIFESLLRDRSIINDASGAAEIIRFRYGESLLASGQYERAGHEFQTVVKRSSESGLVALARLRAAQSMDLAGKRVEAMNAYRAVLSAPDIYNSHEQAKRGLREPYKLK
jgi:hypothetical protein